MKIIDVLGRDAGCEWLLKHGIDPKDAPEDCAVHRTGLLHGEVDVRLRDEDGRLVVAGNSVVRTTVPVRLTSLDRMAFPRGTGRHRKPRWVNTATALHEVNA